MNKSPKLDRLVIKKFLLVALLIPVAALYSLQSLNRLVGLSLLVLAVLLVAHRFFRESRTQWRLQFFIVTICMLPFTNFNASVIFWIFWIFVVCFVVLRPKSDKSGLKTIFVNLIIFVTLFSSIELFFHLPDSLLADRLQLNLKLNRDAGGPFLQKSEKIFFKEVERLRRFNSGMGPNDEYDLVHKKKIKYSGELVSLEDFNGFYIDIKDGKRVTTGSTGLRKKRILVFGGSTIMCGEVPNSMTVTSNLQKLVLDNKFEFDVYNFGISGLRIETQFNRLKTITDLDSDDIVIFYDGVNDVNKIFEQGLERRSDQTPWRQINRVAKTLEARSLLLRKVSITKYVDGLGLSQDYLDNEVDPQISENWFQFEKMARSYTTNKGAKFIHILQPNWLTFRNGDAAADLRKHWSDMRAIQNNFEGYATPENKILNFTKILDGLDTPPFFDWAHLDEVGTAKVAEEMFRVLKPLLEPASK